MLHKYNVQEFTDHLNSIDPHIKFTMEEEQNGTLPFLDTCVHIRDDGSTKVTIYRKATHTDQHLNFDSNHHLSHKRSVVRTLLHRAEHLVTTPQDKLQEQHHVKQALRNNGYKDWMFKLPPKQTSTNSNTDHSNKSTPTIGLPSQLVTTCQAQRSNSG